MFAGAKVEEHEEKTRSRVLIAMSQLRKQLEDAKKQHERERNLPPEKGAQVRKSDLTFLFDDSPSDLAGLTARQTTIDTRPVHSTTALSDLAESASL